MSLTRQVTVWCDDCSAWEQASAAAAPLRKALHAKGWVTVRDPQKGVRDYCPRCAARRREDPCDSTR